MKPALLSVLLFSLSTFADEPKKPESPQSPAAVAAMKDCDKAIEAANKVCREAQTAALRKLIERLKPALAAATKVSNLSEANAIDAQIKVSQGKIDVMASGKSPEKIVEYSLWQIKWYNGVKKYWVYTNGTAKESGGLSGTWKKSGGKMLFEWPSEHDEFVVVGNTVTGKNADNGIVFTIEVLGTNLTGADAPPLAKR